jgi:hypothetical protein
MLPTISLPQLSLTSSSCASVFCALTPYNLGTKLPFWKELCPSCFLDLVLDVITKMLIVFNFFEA